MVQVDEVSKEMDALKSCIENEVLVTLFISKASSSERTEQTGSTFNCCVRHHRCSKISMWPWLNMQS